MRSRYLIMGLQTLTERHRDRLEFSREFNQTAAPFEKIAALFFRKVPPFEILQLYFSIRARAISALNLIDVAFSSWLSDEDNGG